MEGPTTLRTQDFRVLLDAISKSGRRAITLAEFYQDVGKVDVPRRVILRHDVDNDPLIAARMATIEGKSGLRGSYYFRWITARADVISQLRDLGHEVGLHYETLADYAIQHGLRDKSELSDKVIQEMRDMLRSEIETFEERFGPISTVASHGSRVNQLLGLSSFTAILQGENPNEYGIYGSAYGAVMDHSIYHSDLRWDWDALFSDLNGLAPLVYILIHPGRWMGSRHLTRLKGSRWWLQRAPRLVRRPRLFLSLLRHR
jgi:hypothetical protein